MYTRRAEVYNCSKENTDVVGFKWDIYKFLPNYQCITWKGAEVCLKQNQEKARLHSRIQKFMIVRRVLNLSLIKRFCISDWYFAMLMRVVRIQDHSPMNYQCIFATRMKKYFWIILFLVLMGLWKTSRDSKVSFHLAVKTVNGLLQYLFFSLVVFYLLIWSSARILQDQVNFIQCGLGVEASITWTGTWHMSQVYSKKWYE